MNIRGITNKYYAISSLLFNSNKQKKVINVTNNSSRKYWVFLKSCPLFQGLYKSHFNSCWSKIRQKESIRVKLFGFRRIFEYIAVYESCQGSKSVYFLPLALFYSSFCQYSIFKKFSVKITNFGKKLMKIW